METGDQIRGREAVRDFIIALHSQLFDASPELVNITFADGVAGLEAVFVGTHIAEFAGVPATGAAVRLPYSMFYDVAGGAIARATRLLPHHRAGPAAGGSRRARLTLPVRQPGWLATGRPLSARRPRRACPRRRTTARSRC